jgi:hypothetical protein
MRHHGPSSCHSSYSSRKLEESNEIEWRGKGVFIESFGRRGLASLGAHAFYDRSDRYLGQGVATASAGPLHWTAIAGAAKTGVTTRGRWSLETEYLPHHLAGVGARGEDQAADGAEVGFLPYINAHFPGTRYTVRLTVERRVQKGRNATFVELGTVF